MLTAQDTAALVRTHLDLYNRRDFEKGASLVTEDAKIINIPFGITLNGRSGYKEFGQSWANAFTDSKVEATNVIATEEWAVAEYTARGTHNGPLVTPMNTIPATGRKIEMKFCQVFRVRDDKVSEVRLYFDAAGMMRDLGLKL